MTPDEADPSRRVVAAIRWAGCMLRLGEGDRLLIRPAEKITPDIAEQIKAHRPGIIKSVKAAGGVLYPFSPPPTPQQVWGSMKSCRELGWNGNVSKEAPARHLGDTLDGFDAHGDDGDV